MSKPNITASMRSVADVRAATDMQMLQQQQQQQAEMIARLQQQQAALIAKANAAILTPSGPSRGIITGTHGNFAPTPGGFFLNQQKPRDYLSEPESDFFGQVGPTPTTNTDWPSAPLPAGLTGLKVPMGLGKSKLSQQPISATDFAQKAKNALLNDMNMGGKSHRRRAKKAKRSRKARRESMRSRRATMRYLMRTR
jgi:hypothetical protein